MFPQALLPKLYKNETTPPFMNNLIREISYLATVKPTKKERSAL